MYFQIESTKNECSSYYYFDAESIDEAYEKAKKIADEKIILAAYNNKDLFPYCLEPWYKQLPASLKIREYDKNKNVTKRGGIKFKLNRYYSKIKYRDGTQKINYWYQEVV